jgi:septal ring factor EnvC (AmiA/AmiB activator)
VQELGRHRPIGGRSSAIQRYLFEGQALDRAPSGAAVQLIARDTFVAETAVKLDQVGLEMKSLARELQLIKSDMAELRDEASRSYRFSEFIDREHKSRTAKLEELSRRFDYLKSRFDAIDGNSKGDYHAFQNFEQVSRRLTELGALEREFRDVSWKLKLSVAAFAASLLVWFCVLVYG